MTGSYSGCTLIKTITSLWVALCSCRTSAWSPFSQTPRTPWGNRGLSIYHSWSLRNSTTLRLKGKNRLSDYLKRKLHCARRQCPPSPAMPIVAVHAHSVLRSVCWVPRSGVWEQDPGLCTRLRNSLLLLAARRGLGVLLRIGCVACGQPHATERSRPRGRGRTGGLLLTHLGGELLAVAGHLAACLAVPLLLHTARCISRGGARPGGGGAVVPPGPASSGSSRAPCPAGCRAPWSGPVSLCF